MSTLLHSQEALSSSPASPQTLFSQHVEVVRQQGDALQPQRYLRTAPALKAGALAGGMTAFIYESTITAETNLDPTIASAAIALTGLLAVRKLILTPHERKIGKLRYSEKTQAAVGERYELYMAKTDQRAKNFKKQRESVMRWYGVDENSNHRSGDALDHLTYVAMLAKHSNVAKIAIGDALAKQVCPDIDESNQTMAQLLRRSRVSTSGRSASDMIHIKTPDEWLALVKKERSEKGHSLHSMLSTIARLQHDHPLAQAYRQFGASRDELLRPAETAVERQLDSTQTGRRSRLDLPSKQHVNGIIDPTGHTVHRFSNGVYTDTTAFARALGVTDEQLGAAVENELSDPNGAIRALEILVFKRLKELELKPQTDDAASEQPIIDPITPYQTEFITRKAAKEGEDLVLSRWHDLKRTGGFLLSAFVVATGMHVTYNQVTRAYADAAFVHTEAVGIQRGITSPGEQLDLLYDPEVRSLLGPWQLWGDIAKWGADVGNALDHDVVTLSRYPTFFDDSLIGMLPEARMPAVGSQGTIADGRTQTSPNHTDWALEGVNMSTEGYWPTSVNNTVEYRSMGDSSAIQTKWTHNHQRYAELDISLPLLPTSPPAETQSYIAAARQLVSSDVHQIDRSLNIINIPVLEGLMPIAISLDDKAVQVVQRADGTYYVVIDSENDPAVTGKGVLKFWIAPNKRAAQPHLEGRLHVIDGIGTEDQAAPLDRAWEEIIPNLPKATPYAPTNERRTQMIAAYIGTHWSYKLDPWANGKMQGVGSLAEQAKRANQIAKAQCSIANSMVALENESYTAVVGYLNTKGSNALSSREAHLWLTNGEGNRLDATPRSGISAEDAAYFNANTGTPTDIPSNPWLYGELALLAGGLAVWRRRDIKRAVQLAEAGKNKIDELLLITTPVADLRLASSIIGQVVYAPEINFGKARIHAANSSESAEKLTSRFMRANSSLHDKETHRKIRAAAQNSSSPEVKKALKGAAAIARRARRIAQYRQKTAVPTL